MDTSPILGVDRSRPQTYDSRLMILLAIEQSTRQGSIAVLRDAGVVDQRSWNSDRLERQQLFSLMPELLEAAGVALEDVEVFAVGLGPGSFAGARISLSAARAFALPRARTVFGVGSGEAIALDLIREGKVKKVTILGDARRNRVWYAHFAVRNDMPVIQNDWKLTEIDQLREILADSDVVAGPDWPKLEAPIRSGCPGACRIIEGPRFPRASDIGLLAHAGVINGRSSAPLEPIYLHPAVSC